jgi:hypothetical protein
MTQRDTGDCGMKLVKWPKSQLSGTIPFRMYPSEHDVSVVEDWLVDVDGLYFILHSSLVANLKAEWEAIKKADGGKENLPLPTISLSSLVFLPDGTAKILLNEVLNHQGKGPKD